MKPGNLLVADSEVVKLADFGIARATDQSSITQVGSVLGTAAYLAPEQARGEEAGPRADLYSLGVVTYQLLSGRLPYEAASLSELALKQQRESPAPLDELNPQVPRELARAVAMALAMDPDARPADAMVFADGLRKGFAGPRARERHGPDCAPGQPRRDPCPRGRRDRGDAGDPADVATARQTARADPRTAPASGAGAIPRARSRAPTSGGGAGGPGRSSRFVVFLLVFAAAVVAAVVDRDQHLQRRRPLPDRGRPRHPERDQQLRSLVNKYTK